MLRNEILFLIFAALGLLITEVQLSLPVQLIIAATFFALLGLPHGALDHLIFMGVAKWSPLPFYTFYLGIMVVYTFAWLLAPGPSLALFLVMSAFHFGQSQFSQYQQISRWVKPLLYLAWGISLLSGMLYFNLAATETLMMDCVACQVPEWLVSATTIPWLFYSTLEFTSALLIGQYGLGNMDWKNFIRELVLFVCIHLSFALLEPIIAFTLFFTFVHSMRVLVDEFEFFQQKKLSSFIKSLLPLTVLSLVGISLLLVMMKMGWFLVVWNVYEQDQTLNNLSIKLLLSTVKNFPFQERMLSE